MNRLESRIILLPSVRIPAIRAWATMPRPATNSADHIAGTHAIVEAGCRVDSRIWRVAINELTMRSVGVSGSGRITFRQ